MERAEEIELARQLLDGKAEAFDRFVEHFRSKIFNYSRLICGHREDAEEVAQEALLKVFESFDQLRDPGSVRAWVFRKAVTQPYPSIRFRDSSRLYFVWISLRTLFCGGPDRTRICDLYRVKVAL